MYRLVAESGGKKLKTNEIINLYMNFVNNSVLKQGLKLFKKLIKKEPVYFLS